MIDKNSKLITDDLGTRPGIRNRIDARKTVEYHLRYEDVNTITGLHPLEQLALKLYDDSRYWYVIADVNPVRDPTEWKVGDVILLPLDDLTTMIRRVKDEQLV